MQTRYNQLWRFCCFQQVHYISSRVFLHPWKYIVLLYRTALILKILNRTATYYPVERTNWVSFTIMRPVSFLLSNVSLCNKIYSFIYWVINSCLLILCGNSNCYKVASVLFSWINVYPICNVVGSKIQMSTSICRNKTEIHTH